MGKITKTFKETGFLQPSDASTWTVVSTIDDVICKDGNLSGLEFPTKTSAKYSKVTGKNCADIRMEFGLFFKGEFRAWYLSAAEYISLNYNTERLFNNTIEFRDEVVLFDQSNPEERKISVTLKSAYLYLESGKKAGDGVTDPCGAYHNSSTLNWGTICNIVLDAPPTFKKGELIMDKPLPHTKITTASINISEMVAQCGGYITKAVLKIGNQESEPLVGDSTNILENGTLSMILSEAGENLPVSVTVTDSRGQTTTETLDPITVFQYNSPAVSFTLERASSAGASDESGTYAVATAQFTFTDTIATLSEPIVTGASNVTWYIARTESGAIDTSSEVDWNDTSGFTTGVTLYALMDSFSEPNDNYPITIQPRDSETIGEELTVILPSAFYVIDFLAGGDGVAFGKAAEMSDYFECDLNIQFNKTIESMSKDYERDTTDIDAKISKGMSFLDKNREEIAYVQPFIEWDSQNRPIEGLSIGTWRQVGDSEKWNSIRVLIDADGNPIIKLNQPKAWRKAIGLDAGYISVGEVAANSYKDVTISYSFSWAPKVVATLYSSGTAVNIGNVSISIHSITNTSAKARIFNNRSTTISPGIEWIAVLV